MNAVLCSGLAKDPDGMRELYMDNWYSSPSTIFWHAVWFEAIGMAGIRRSWICKKLSTQRFVFAKVWPNKQIIIWSLEWQ
jgi:hypothetical protein